MSAFLKMIDFQQNTRLLLININAKWTHGLDSNCFCSSCLYPAHSKTLNRRCAQSSLHPGNVSFETFFSPSKAVPFVALVLRGLYLGAPLHTVNKQHWGFKRPASFSPLSLWARCFVAHSVLALSLGSIGLAFQLLHAQYFLGSWGSLCTGLGCVHCRVTLACQCKLIYVVQNNKNVKINISKEEQVCNGKHCSGITLNYNIIFDYLVVAWLKWCYFS